VRGRLPDEHEVPAAGGPRVRALHSSDVVL